MEMELLLNNYFSNGRWRRIEQQGSGMNNTTSFIEADGDQYVLRIYETHREVEKVQYEHAVLLSLAGQELPFQTPIPVRARDGKTYVHTPDGKLAAMFRYLEGERPRLADESAWQGFGEAVAWLSSALAEVRLEETPVYRPYYEIEHTHPRCGLDDAIRFCINPSEEFSSEKLTESLKYIASCLQSVEGKHPLLQTLPHQLIHGDINASNMLADSSDKLVAVLDFEFVTWDLRVMEIAVCLSDLIDPEQDQRAMWDKVKALLAGYCGKIALTVEEIQVLPTLLLLRRLDVFIHFLGRYWDGVDSVEVVQRQILSTYETAKWLEVNGDRILTD